MKIERFTARNLLEAMNSIHARFSRDAVILECTRKANGVEVLAALDHDTDTAANGGAQQIEVIAPSQEVAELRQIIREQLAGLIWSPSPGAPPHLARLLELFARLGVEENLAQELLADLPVLDAGHLQDLALRLLCERIPVIPAAVLAFAENEQQVIALVGPSAVGKTTTIAKLAARHIQQFGRQSVALIAAHDRPGVSEQLVRYGERLGVPVHAARDSRELQALLGELCTYKLVLIDTEVMSPCDRVPARQLALFGPLAGCLRTYLVMAANSQFDTCGHIIRQFRAVPLAGVILTKLDEASQFGGVLSSLIRHELGVAWVTNGQRVPEDLHHLRAEELLARALVLSEHGTAPAVDSASPQGTAAHSGHLRDVSI